MFPWKTTPSSAPMWKNHENMKYFHENATTKQTNMIKTTTTR